MVEAASTSETSVNSYHITWCNNPEDSHLQHKYSSAISDKALAYSDPKLTA
jgi:hypothetical protein